ncbi:unnamed protein product [Polarella glacialis]|uniref:Transglutaminase-like domain-containing protein n=1 Tax=Polarella glacialis TaxID=89957 RepID=A0A813KMI0_POLGL|nr:unnamed protein product [Polarella glacialis]CAE8708075.1 unnamed protein product [Polarella glacialis]
MAKKIAKSQSRPRGPRRSSAPVKAKQRRPSLQASLTMAEEKPLSGIKCPGDIQDMLDKLPYDASYYCRSVKQTLQLKQGHCFAGALLGAHCLTRLGYPPLVVSMLADPSLDDSHAIAVYQKDGLWGSVSKSNYTGVRGRDPVYKSVRELVMSYYNFYCNKEGIKTLVAHSAPINLNKVDRAQEWVYRTDVKNGARKVDKATECWTKKLLPKSFTRSKLTVLKGTTLKGQVLGANKAGLFKTAC